MLSLACNSPPLHLFQHFVSVNPVGKNENKGAGNFQTVICLSVRAGHGPSMRVTNAFYPLFFLGGRALAFRRDPSPL